MFLRQIHDGFSYIGNTGPYEVSKKLLTLCLCVGDWGSTFCD
jgi:hypothetical protein